ncbi:MAG: hypothetical protein ACREPV_01065 [Lysobacter sp.]
MHRFRHRKLSTPARLLVLLVFALALLVQPVLASVGEVHELAHDPSGLHSHAEHPGDTAAEPASSGELGDEETSTLHLLLHFAHCCGHATAAPLATIKVAAPMPATQPAMTHAQVISQTLLFAPFRPPITA